MTFCNISSYRRIRCSMFSIFLILLACFGLVYFIISLKFTHAGNLVSRDHDGELRKVGCVFPSLPIWTAQLLKDYAEFPEPKLCSPVERPWVYTNNGTFRISAEAIKKHGRINCSYTPILRNRDDFSIRPGSVIKFIKDGDDLLSDFFEVTCKSESNASYQNKHAAISRNKEALKRSSLKLMDKAKMGLNSLGMNVIFFGFDSVSRLTWLRSLPKSHSYFVNVLGGVVLESYNIVGDGTTHALLPILTGKPEIELPETRRGFKNANTVDNYPWIWKGLNDIGYVTQYGEEEPRIGTFTMRLRGFRDQPVDHYYRTYTLAIKDQSRYPFCFINGSNSDMIKWTRFLQQKQWMQDFLELYRDRPKFSFIFSSELSHGSILRFPRFVDNELLKLLTHLNEAGHLDNTLLITMSDHGSRSGAMRKTDEGRMEERNPYFGIRIPPKLRSKYPEAYRNLKVNARRLSTPFDIHATLREIINFTGTDEGELKARGISLFKEIPIERSCVDADIEPHWCSCLDRMSLSSNDTNVTQAAEAIVEFINEQTKPERNVCSEISLNEIRSAIRLTTNQQVLRFRKTNDYHGRKADVSDTKRQASLILYTVTLETKPGEGLYEATVRRSPGAKSDDYSTDSNSISRINLYGDQPHCIADRLPHLRPFCYCKTQRKKS